MVHGGGGNGGYGMTSQFKAGDLVRVTNVNGWDSNGKIFEGLFTIAGVGDTGIVVDVLDSKWPIEVMHDYGTFTYKESELELVEE